MKGFKGWKVRLDGVAVAGSRFTVGSDLSAAGFVEALAAGLDLPTGFVAAAFTSLLRAMAKSQPCPNTSLGDGAKTVHPKP